MHDNVAATGYAGAVNDDEGFVDEAGTMQLDRGPTHELAPDLRRISRFDADRRTNAWLRRRQLFELSAVDKSPQDPGNVRIFKIPV